MRKSLWMIPTVLLVLFMVLGSTNARADSIVMSGGVVTGIDGITIDGTTYNVTFGTTEDMTLSGNTAAAAAAAADISNDLNGYDCVTVYCYESIGVYATSTVTDEALGNGSGSWGVGTDTSTGFNALVAENGTGAAWAEFDPPSSVATPEPSNLLLLGVGLLAMSGLIAYQRNKNGGLQAQAVSPSDVAAN
jgi:hypothetical protein